MHDYAAATIFMKKKDFACRIFLEYSKDSLACVSNKGAGSSTAIMNIKYSHYYGSSCDRERKCGMKVVSILKKNVGSGH